MDLEELMRSIREQVAQEMRDQLSLQSKQQSEQIAQLLQTKTADKGGFLVQNKGGSDGMDYYIPKGCTLFQRKSDSRWEGKVRINGKQIPVACRMSKKFVYDEMMKVYRENKKNKRVQVKEKEFTLFTWMDHWHKLYRIPKYENNELSKNTIIMDLSMIRRIKKDFKDVKLRELKSDYIQEKLNIMKHRRTAEGIYTLLKLALAKAKDRTSGRNIMENVEMIKHRRISGRALTQEEVNKLLNATNNETEKDVIRVYVNTGCRVDEMPRILIGHINFSNEPRIFTNLKFHGRPVPDMKVFPNEIFIYGTKTRGSIRTMPITPKLKPILEKLVKDRKDDEKLFRYTTVMIRNFHKPIKEKSGVEYTLKDYRHTCATNFKDAGIPSSVYFRWFGWTDDTMARRVYTHETDYEKKLSQEWAAKFGA